MTTKWFSFTPPENGVAEISIFDEIGLWGVTAKDFQRDFQQIRDVDQIRVTVNSPGGSFFDGMAIYQLLSSARDRVDVEVYGIAASIASVIALAGRSLKMADGSYFMIHNPYTIMAGSGEELRKAADTLDKMRNDIGRIYAEKTGLSIKDVLALMDGETWYTAAEAKEAGFADEVAQYGKAAARIPDLSRFNFAKTPSELLEASDDGPTVRDVERSLRDAGVSKSVSRRIAKEAVESTPGASYELHERAREIRLRAAMLLNE